VGRAEPTTRGLLWGLRESVPPHCRSHPPLRIVSGVPGTLMRRKGIVYGATTFVVLFIVYQAARSPPRDIPPSIEPSIPYQVMSWASGKRHLSSQQRKVILQKANSLYQGRFARDSSFWMERCTPTPTDDPMCEMAPVPGRMRGKARVPAKLTSWAPQEKIEDCPFRYFTHDEAVAAFTSMGVKRVHLIGDSMIR
jgi:hypothetical protein